MALYWVVTNNDKHEDNNEIMIDYIDNNDKHGDKQCNITWAMQCILNILFLFKFQMSW